MRLLALSALLLAAATASAADCVRVWVPGCWSTGVNRTWIPGRYEERVVTTTTTTTYTVPPPPPQQVWVPERWEWNGQAWELRPGYWTPGGPPVVAVQPTTTTTTRTVEVVEPRPRVSVGVGFVVGGSSCDDGWSRRRHHHGYSHHGHSGIGHGSTTRRVDVRPPAPLPGSHALPRPPRWVPDPVGVFRHDPLHLLRK